MFILDTNVISEIIRPAPSDAVLEWLSERDARELFLTSVTCAELYYGIERLGLGRRRDLLAERIEGLIRGDFAERVLGYGVSAASYYAEIAARREKMGRRISPQDGMIAAIARLHDAAIATRDNDFEGCGVDVFDPWGGGASGA